ncbi:hypothetical protein GTW71_17600, partial [Streptomyces sp. SID6041]|nr:hypothetical protein [Streptomyces sp. SID6041]
FADGTAPADGSAEVDGSASADGSGVADGPAQVGGSGVVDRDLVDGVYGLLPFAVPAAALTALVVLLLLSAPAGLPGAGAAAGAVLRAVL